jgi:hypothetical protein
MNEAASTFPVVLLFKFAFTVLRVRSRLAFSTFATLRTYCLAANSVVEFSLDPTKAWAEDLLTRASQTREALAQLMSDIRAIRWPDLIQKSGRRGALHYLGSKVYAAAPLAVYAMGHTVETAILAVAASSLYVTHSSSRLSAALQKTTMENDRRRLRSFKAIVDEQRSPIFCWVLLVWLVARSPHIDLVLGDFSEGYEMKKAKYGESDAVNWSRQQALKEVSDRIKGTFQILGWASAFAHSILKHFKKH